MNIQQEEEMVNFMEKHPQLAKGFAKGDRVEIEKLWQNLTDTLNSLGGPVKECDGWKKVFSITIHNYALLTMNFCRYGAIRSRLLKRNLQQISVKPELREEGHIIRYTYHLERKPLLGYVGFTMLLRGLIKAYLLVTNQL